MLSRMVELELVEMREEGTRQLYLISERGKDFLRILNDLKRVLSSPSGFSDSIDSIVCTFSEEDL